MDKKECLQKNCCYADTLKGFLNEKPDERLAGMKSAFAEQYNLELGQSQVSAWEDCFLHLQKYLPLIEDKNKNFGIIFEYALPYESGRRPDVLLISKEQVIVLEFKRNSAAMPQDIDQIAEYARNIANYHFKSRNKSVVPVLVLTRTTGLKPQKTQNGVISVSSDLLPQLIDNTATDSVTQCNLNSWMNSDYRPLPSIVEMARAFFNKDKLPAIKKVNGTNLPQAIEFLRQLTAGAKADKKHLPALVTGAPGSGKTYLGPEYVYGVC